MIVALELSAERRAATASSDARTMLIRALVAGSDVDAAIYRRAEQYGLKINEPHVVCVLSCVESSDDDSLALLDLESALRGIDASSEGWAATVERRVVLILGIDSPLDHPTAVHDATAVVARIVKQLAPDGGLTAGISGVCAQREDYRRGYQEACDVRSLLDTVFAGPNRPSVLAAADLGPGRLMLSMTDQDGAQRFARDTLGSLLALQPEKPDSLLNTLLVFFAASRCVRDAAQWMEVHENTIRYRLTRIAKVTGLDIANDADAQLSVQLAMLVLQFAGELSQPVRPPALQGP
jgi:sugar diacid utilization regulator